MDNNNIDIKRLAIVFKQGGQLNNYELTMLYEHGEISASELVKAVDYYA